MPGRTVVLRDASGAEHHVEIVETDAVIVDGRVVTVSFLQPGEYRAGEHAVWAAANSDLRWVFIDGATYTFDVRQLREAPRRVRNRGGETLSAPMPATVIKIQVSPGDRVRAGDVLIVLEAMKMELPVRAHANGVVQSVRCTTGELVQPEQELIVMTAEGS